MSTSPGVARPGGVMTTTRKAIGGVRRALRGGGGRCSGRGWPGGGGGGGGGGSHVFGHASVHRPGRLVVPFRAYDVVCER